MRYVVAEMKAFSFAVLALRHQLAVGQDGHRRRDAGDHLARRLLVRMIEAGEPAAVVLVLPLRPALERTLRIGLVGMDEIEPAPRRAAVTDDEVERLALLALAQIERQRLAVVLERDALAVAERDGVDGHLD